MAIEKKLLELAKSQLKLRRDVQNLKSLYLASSNRLTSINQYGDSGKNNIIIVINVGVVIKIYAVTLHEQ